MEAEPVQGEKDFPFCVFVQGRRVFFVFVQREKIFCVFVSMCSNSHSSLGGFTSHITHIVTLDVDSNCYLLSFNINYKVLAGSHKMGRVDTQLIGFLLSSSFF